MDSFMKRFHNKSFFAKKCSNLVSSTRSEPLDGGLTGVHAVVQMFKSLPVTWGKPVWYTLTHKGQWCWLRNSLSAQKADEPKIWCDILLFKVVCSSVYNDMSKNSFYLRRSSLIEKKISPIWQIWLIRMKKKQSAGLLFRENDVCNLYGVCNCFASSSFLEKT